jgi:hypothetical protein
MPVNLLLRPQTRLARIEGGLEVAETVPAGFIFHVSRCGSTLVSGCLSELGHAAVLSESPLLTDVLLDPGLGAARNRLLPVLLDLQTRALASSKLVVKWNAWDLFYWPLIRSLYPDVPVLMLFRDPLEVLASHCAQAGRHMAGDPVLADAHPVFAGMSAGEDILDFRKRILHALLQAAAAVCNDPGVMAVDYTQLNAEKIRAISRHFGIAPRGDEDARMRQRMQFHSKEPRRDFRPDGSRKREAFGANERVRIRGALEPPYQRLLPFAGLSPEAMAC